MTATLCLRTNLHPDSIKSGQEYFGMLFFSLVVILFDGFAEETLTVRFATALVTSRMCCSCDGCQPCRVTALVVCLACTSLSTTRNGPPAVTPACPAGATADWLVKAAGQLLLSSLGVCGAHYRAPRALQPDGGHHVVLRHLLHRRPRPRAQQVCCAYTAPPPLRLVCGRALHRRDHPRCSTPLT